MTHLFKAEQTDVSLQVITYFHPSFEGKWLFRLIKQKYEWKIFRANRMT